MPELKHEPAEPRSTGEVQAQAYQQQLTLRARQLEERSQQLAELALELCKREMDLTDREQDLVAGLRELALRAGHAEQALQQAVQRGEAAIARERACFEAEQQLGRARADLEAAQRAASEQPVHDAAQHALHADQLRADEWGAPHVWDVCARIPATVNPGVLAGELERQLRQLPYVHGVRVRWVPGRAG